MKLKLLPLLPLSLLLFSCGGDKPAGPEEPKYDEYSVNFATIDLGDSGILQSSDSTFKSKIMGYINGTNEFLSDVEVEDPNSNGVRIQKKVFYGEYGSAQGLIIGSQDADGKITFTFAKELSYVSIKAQQYYNLQMDYSAGTPFINPNYDGQEYIEIEEDPGYYFEGYFNLNVNNTLYKEPDAEKPHVRFCGYDSWKRTDYLTDTIVIYFI